ncbi:MAG: biotin/lipoyl-containing protein [Anaerolineae bacterium]
MPIYHVTVDDQEYTVEIPNPRERPIRAIVEGETIEVRVEDVAREGTTPPPEAPRPPVSTVGTAVRAAPPTTGAATGQVTAPLPGVVTTISVAEGDEVQPGEELCILEAMKMNNPIRSTVSGTVTEVHIRVGEQVQHGAPLFTIE